MLHSSLLTVTQLAATSLAWGRRGARRQSAASGAAQLEPLRIAERSSSEAVMLGHSVLKWYYA